jgi:hypothetical protein
MDVVGLTIILHAGQEGNWIHVLLSTTLVTQVVGDNADVIVKRLPSGMCPQHPTPLVCDFPVLNR